MPHFTLRLNENGSIRQLLRDGEPYNRAIKLEPAYMIVSTYFRLAASNIAGMAKAPDGELRRFHGLQAFLMTLTGVEAFANVFFTLHGKNNNNDALLNKVRERNGALVPRLTACIPLAFGGPVEDQDRLLGRIRELYALRDQIVHPRWDPTSAAIDGETSLRFNGFALNVQAGFEEERLCREAFLWCMLLVIRIASAAQTTDIEAFCRLWTCQEGASEGAILEQLGIVDREEGLSGKTERETEQTLRAGQPSLLPRVLQANIVRFYEMAVRPMLDRATVSKESVSLDTAADYEGRLDVLARQIDNHTADEARRALALTLASTFERQLRIFAREVLPQKVRPKVARQNLMELLEMVAADQTIDLQTASLGGVLAELLTLANAVRHGDGPACDRLAAVAPRFWLDVGSASQAMPPALEAQSERIRIADEDFRLYVSAIVRLWGLADRLEGAVLFAPIS
jgi:hypothetical protein